jgi:hypothetical protein
LICIVGCNANTLKVLEVEEVEVYVKGLAKLSLISKAYIVFHP